MAQQNIDFGSFPDDPDADAIRTAFQKVQTNFNELYATATAGSVTLTGIIKKQKLYINKNKYIKLYSKNKNILPKDGQNITILSGHLSPYKGNMQIIIYKSTDYKVNN